MPEHTRRRAVIYVRISQDRTGAGLGVERQEADCRKLAERLDWDVVAVHSDNDVSAFTGKRRRGYRALLDDITSGSIHGVLAWHPDRLHRSPTELEDYITACEQHDVVTHTVQSGVVDLSTPAGRMQARIAGAVARNESEHKGERVRAARQQNALAGRWSGGRRPFGFEPDGVTLRPAEAQEIAAAAESLLAGSSLRSIVREWNARGVPTPLGAPAWTSIAIRDILVRPRTAGLAMYRGEVVGEATWPAIVPEAQWRAVVSLLANPARRTSPGGQVRWLGSGLYICGVCGQPNLRVTSNSRGKPSYRCESRNVVAGTTGHVMRDARYLDAFVEAHIVERLKRPDAASLLRPASSAEIDVTAARAEAAAVRERLNELASAFADGVVTVGQLREGTERGRHKLRELESEIERAATTTPLAGLVGAADVEAAWAALDIHRRRAVLSTLLDVTVLLVAGRRGPGGSRFDPAGVRIDWLR